MALKKLLENKTHLLLAVSLVLGLVAALLAWHHEVTVEGAQVKILIAIETIPAGTHVTKTMFQVVPIRGDLAQITSAMIPEQDFTAFEQQPLALGLKKNEILQINHFSTSGNRGLSASIAKNQRALAIDVQDEGQSVAYLVRSGMAVDVYGFINQKAQLLKAHACVISVGDSYLMASENKDTHYRSVTLLLDEDDVQPLMTNLFLAQRNVKLSLAGDCNPHLHQKALPPVAQVENPGLKLPEMPSATGQ